MKRSFALAGAAMLALALTASLSMAQPDKGQPQSPPAASQSQPATPATPATPAAPGESSATPASPAAPAAAAAEPAAAPTVANTSEAPRGCRTRKEAGEPCACLSDPNRVGMSTAHPAGHNVCVRPD